MNGEQTDARNQLAQRIEAGIKERQAIVDAMLPEADEVTRHFWLSIDHVVNDVLSDVPLLMQALGATKQSACQCVLPGAVYGDCGLHPAEAAERWVTPWQEISK